MSGYTYTELGMLIGAAIGGVLALLGFSVCNSSISYILAAFSIALGTFTGNIIEKKQIQNK